MNSFRAIDNRTTLDFRACYLARVGLDKGHLFPVVEDEDGEIAMGISPKISGHQSTECWQSIWFHFFRYKEQYGH